MHLKRGQVLHVPDSYLRREYKMEALERAVKDVHERISVVLSSPLVRASVLVPS